jgi:hypothetical protein
MLPLTPLQLPALPTLDVEDRAALEDLYVRGGTVALILGEPPHLNWSTAMFRKRKTTNDKQATEARGDCLEVTAG